jgi:methenyltetrahydromethanopterin cyclohydrolase
VPEYSLLGLNSLDFIVDGEHCQLMEINPRPSASMILYDAEYKSGLLQEHVNACSETFTSVWSSHPEIIAFQVLYASNDLYVASGFDWPDWSMDRPVCPCKIYHGQPICSIIATDTNSQQVFQQLRNKQQIIIDLIEGK